MKILALDLATKTGFAHSCGASGVWDLKIFPDESQGMRLIRFAAKIREVQLALGFDVLAFEAVSAGIGTTGSMETLKKRKTNFGSVKLCTELQAVIKLIADEPDSDFECMSVNLQTIKAHALSGPGKRDKEAMGAAAREKWPGKVFVDDNEIDALWLLDYMSHRLALTQEVIEHELKTAPIDVQDDQPGQPLLDLAENF